VLLTAAACLTAMAAASTPATAASSYPGWHKKALNVTPRAQWNANDGYCGETSMITAGLAFGQYTSQWTARNLASPGVPQTRPDSQLLLGVNDTAAAAAMRLEARRAPATKNFRTFTTWARNRFLAGDVVVVGVFNNTRMLGETGAGDPTYDHIVPVYGYESAKPLRAGRASLGTDVLTISDNGLRTLGPNAPMLYSYTLDDIQRTRRGANAAGGPVYSFPTSGPWYGVAVTGVLDSDHTTLPVKVAVNVNSEGVQNESALTAAPMAEPIRLTVTLARPDNAREAVLYQYDDFASVPTGAFNAHAGDAAHVWRVPAGSGPYTVTVDAMSNDTRVFRAVPADAP